MSNDLVSQHFANIFDPFKELGTVLKGELKRTVINLNQFLRLTLGPTMSSADYQKLLKKNRAKIKEIDNEVDAALSKVPIPGGLKAMAFIANPGMGLAMAARATSEKITPDSVQKFSDEYGFSDLMIGRFPIGKLTTWAAKKGAMVGGFATLNIDAIEKSEKDQEEAARTKWYTPIERLLLLQNPFKSPVAESTFYSGHLLLEAEGGDPETEAFANFLNGHDSMQQYYQAVGVPYIKAHDELVTGLVDLFEQEIKDITDISTASTFPDFIKAIQEAKSEKFKSLNVAQMKKGMETTVEDLVGNEEELNKFLEAAGKNKQELGDDKKVSEFIMQKVYEKEFSKTRADSLISVQNGVDEIKDTILGDLDEEDVEKLKGTPIGNQLADIINSGLERLDKAVESLSALKSKI